MLRSSESYSGLTAEQQKIAHELALSGLIRLRAAGAMTATLLSPEVTDEIIDFISGGIRSGLPLPQNELNVSHQGSCAQNWHADTYLADRTFDVLVVGAGVAGIAAGYRYLQAGLPITMIEAAAGVGEPG